MKENIKRSYIFNIISIILLFIVMKVLISTNILTRYYTGIVIFICINIVLATSLNLATGFLGQLALGHAGFMAVGGLCLGNNCNCIETCNEIHTGKPGCTRSNS